MVTAVVALLSVLVAALLSWSLVRRAADTSARRQLGRQAELVAGLSPGRTVPERVRRLLGQSGIRVLIVLPDGQIADHSRLLPRTDRQTLKAGRIVSKVETIDGRRAYVEGRPRDSGGAVALVQPARNAPAEQRSFLDRELVALLVGLAVAVVAGSLLAWWLARPLRRVAAGAHVMAAGDRAVRIGPEGPAEVAAVAEAVNGLAAAVQAGESRQRDFLLSISHELRTPLTTISGFAEALTDGVATDVASTGQIMLTEAQRLERLIGDLLALARMEAEDFRIDLQPADLSGIVRQAARAWQPRCAAAGVRFTLQEAPAPVMVRTDPARVRQVIDALVDNALRVTPGGAQIVLAARGTASGGVIEVRDAGPGLSDSDIPVAFERSRLHERYRGERGGTAGIGLALVDRLATRLGGRAVAGHAPEGGALFAIELPSDRPTSA
jgi:two-component system sensor histidine kinase BaeS